MMNWPWIQPIAQALQGNTQIFSWGVGIVLFLWVIFILWTMKDISARSNSVLVQILCILLVGVGTPIV